MKTLKAIIIDDETNARLVIRGMMKENFPAVQVLGEAKDLPSGVKLIHQFNPDIVFLDIEMPQFSGLEIVDFFPPEQINFQIIFVTAYDKYAIDAFKVSAIDYLIKPVQLEDLGRAIQKVENLNTLKYQTLKENLKSAKPKKILVNGAGGQIIIPIEDILYIKADGSYSDIFLADGTKHCVTKKLIDFEVLKQTNDFERVHRSFIINLQHVQKFFKSDGGGVVMSNGEELSVSKEKREELEQRLALIRI